MSLPACVFLRIRDSHRLIAANQRNGSGLERIADDAAHLLVLTELEQATNDRPRGECDLLPGIGRDQLVAGVPLAAVINAAFCYASPEGGRFNGPDQGAWYAGFELETSQAEITHHKSRHYLEIDWQAEDATAYDDYLANFEGEFHDIRNAAAFAPCLDPGSYLASQALALELLKIGAPGIVYPSARTRGSCLACLRPSLVQNVRLSTPHAFLWRGLRSGPVWLEP
uniref:RES domain-containing protein n=1 Tax=Desulfovibrio sp. U5L TaxID=596152 RepID=I2Q7I8_9BACT